MISGVFMNTYFKNLNRIEFVVTNSCTGRCKHCSQGEHSGLSHFIDMDIAVKLVSDVAAVFTIESVMTFGGEPLLYPDTVCAVHKAARKMNIPQRQLITNGYFTKSTDNMKSVVAKLNNSGVNEIHLSADAFHQETIPFEAVKAFAAEILKYKISISVHPAWLVNKSADNEYNRRTKEILAVFEQMGIEQSSGNDIIPVGNAQKYFSEYYDLSKEYVSPYAENPFDVHTITISPNGDVLGGNIYKDDILTILDGYQPE